MSTLEKALELALKAHAGQKDRAGEPYIFHPLRVMQNVNHEKAKIVALLHDVLEDSSFTLDDLKAAQFDEQIVKAVDQLTRKTDEDYWAYLRRIVQNPLAKQVKIADLKDNLDASRLNKITEDDRQRLNKYLKALKILQESD